MLEILLRKQFSPVLVRHISVTVKLSYCDSSLVKSEPKLKSLVESDFSRVAKKSFKKNFIENLFINKFETDVFQYPQLDTIEEVDRLKNYCLFAKKLIADEIGTKNISSNSDFKNAVTTLKKFELTGFKTPRVKNGFGFLSSEFSYMLEALGADPSLSKTVCENEDFGIQLIDSFGNDMQKGEYFSKLINGENISTLAHLESGNFIPFEEKSLNTTAVSSSDNQNYIISGTKTWVYNANFADLFILSACIKTSDKEEVLKPTLFLVNKNLPGIIIHEPIETMGMKNLNICNVTFNEVAVPFSSIIGNINEGGEIIKKILCKGKLNNGGQCLAIMKKLVNKCIKHCIHGEFFNKDKYNMDCFRIKIGQMVARVYIVESMTYLLTGRFDSYTDPDVFLESLIVKVFSSESLQFIIKEAIEILGNDFFTNNENLSQLVKDAQFYTACDDTNDHLRLVLSSAGLKYAMDHMAHPYGKISKFFDSLKFTKKIDRDKKVIHKKELQWYLHLMFKTESWILEDSVDILDECTQYLIKTYKKDVFHKYLELKYLADIAINIYAMTATLGRASRAYCLGLQFYEVDRISAEIEIRKLSFQNRRTRILIQNIAEFSDFSRISFSIMNSNKYSDLFPIVKSQNQVKTASAKQ